MLGGPDELAGLLADRHHVRVAEAGKQQPVADADAPLAAERHLRLERPECRAGRRVERHDHAGRRDDEHASVLDHRRGFGAVGRLDHPGAAQLLDVPRIDLAERGVAGAGPVAPRRPIPSQDMAVLVRQIASETPRTGPGRSWTAQPSANDRVASDLLCPTNLSRTHQDTAKPIPADSVWDGLNGRRGERDRKQTHGHFMTPSFDSPFPSPLYAITPSTPLPHCAETVARLPVTVAHSLSDACYHGRPESSMSPAAILAHLLLLMSLAAPQGSARAARAPGDLFAQIYQRGLIKQRRHKIDSGQFHRDDRVVAAGQADRGARYRVAAPPARVRMTVYRA